MAGLVDIVVGLVRKVGDLERRLANMGRHGPVAEVDAQKGMVRLRIGGTDEEPMLSAWAPYAQMAGALKVHSPPSVGQQMTLFSPNGDIQQGVAIPNTWSDDNASPAGAGDKNVLTFGSVRIDLRDNEVKITVGQMNVLIKEDVFRARIGEGASAPRVVVRPTYVKMRRNDHWLIVTNDDVRQSEPIVTLPDPEPSY